MKKAIISIAVSLSLLIGMFSVIMAVPTSAASGVDFLEDSTLSANSSTPDSAYSLADHVLTFNATKADQEVTFTVDNEANLNEYPYIQLSISSTAKFDVAFYDKNNVKWMFAAGDFCYNFGEYLSPSNPIPAGEYNVEFSPAGAYTWTGAPLPANAAICSFTFIAKEAGTITVTKCAVTDGMENFDLNTRGDQSQQPWANRVNLIAGDYTNAPAPDPRDPRSNITVTKNADGSIAYGNTAALWPAASYTFDEPIVVDSSAALDLDFAVSPGCTTTIYVYFGPSTPASFGDEAYIWIANPEDILVADLGKGHYKGVLFLEDTIKKTIGSLDAVNKCYDANGNFVVTGVKIFATSNAVTSNAVTFRKFDLVSLEGNDPLPPSTESPTTPTTPQPIPEGLVYTVSDAAVTVTDYNGTATSIEIPSQIEGKPVTAIDDDAFRNCDTLEEVLLPETLQSIGSRVFYGCDSLELMDIPNSVTTLGDNAFYGCKALTHVRVGSGVQTVPSSAFYLCSSLSSVELPAGLTEIHSMAFQGCSSLTDVLFDGSEEQWKAVSITYSGNNALRKATVSYDCAPETQAPSTAVWGDVNGDGVTNLQDAVQLFYYINGTSGR